VTVYGEQHLIDFARKHAGARKPIARFLALVKGAQWKHAEEMKQTLPSVDYAAETKTAIFDLGGNKYRVFARVNFAEQALRILEALTHEQYDRRKL